MNAKMVALTAVNLAALATACGIAGESTNVQAVLWILPTNTPSFFCSDHLTGATYYQFSPDQTYVMIAKEHMGVWPLDGGRWIQASDGVVTMTSTNAKRAARGPQVMKPMQYKGKTFLIWPGKSYGTDTLRVCLFIDSPTNTPHVYNEFMITEAEFLKGTGKPFPFKYHTEMNKLTGAE